MQLDDLVDYLTYVFVPALIVWRALLVVDPWSKACRQPCCCRAATASAT
jgi:phosphatidylserine synthase